MDLNTFSRLIARTKLGTDACRMARDMLVYGLGPKESAARAHRKPGEATKAARHIARCLMDEGGYPATWEVVTVVLPPELADQVFDLAWSKALDVGLPYGPPRKVPSECSADDYEPIEP
jgi:hypothetical protein